MKKLIFANLLILFISISANAQTINCRVDSFSAKEGASTAPLTPVDDRLLVLDFNQHHFEVEVDKVKKVIFFEIKEIGGMPRASGISPMPNTNGPFLLKYINRANTEVHTLKCFSPDGE